MSKAGTLKALIATPDLFLAPGCFDGLSARLVEQAGFQIAYASGGAIARGYGVPDLGLLAFTEVADRMEQIASAVDIPVIADFDTGYGNALNAQRAARFFLRSGVAGIHIEDQTFPKKCGHYDDKSVVPAAVMQGKIRAVRDVVGDDLVLIARTDALAVEGFDRAIERCHAYSEAGADMIFFEAPQTEEQIREAARLLPCPKLLNMFRGGKTPPVPLPRLRELGYRVVIVPSDLQRAAIHAMMRALEALGRDGDTAAIADEMVSFRDREAIVGSERYDQLDRRYAE
ncbi:MAG TPA: oxaloacetate decarboxylase [Paracoccaceae bacterium]|nr:oxaloacetate decarboxylase [Paracoccaceae bacterium]